MVSILLNSLLTLLRPVPSPDKVVFYSHPDTVCELPKKDERSDVESVGAFSGACGARFNTSRPRGGAGPTLSIRQQDPS